MPIYSACSFSTVFEKVPNTSLPHKYDSQLNSSGPIASFPEIDYWVNFRTWAWSCSWISWSLHRFWEIEEVPQKASRNPEEQCEEDFRAIHSRTPEGRYIVRLPFKNYPPISISESRSIAISNLKQRLIRDSINVSEYREFLAEYETFDHMIKSSPTEIVKPEQIYYIPHYAVLHDSNATSRLRVVFNALCHTSNGMSSNDYMLVLDFRGI